jgi:hypothetical protein
MNAVFDQIMISLCGPKSNIESDSDAKELFNKAVKTLLEEMQYYGECFENIVFNHFN